MGEVYVAQDPQIGRRLAIKTVRLAGRPQEIDERKRRLLREAQAAGRLLHPNVVTLFDAGEDEGVLFLAFEFVEGMDLAARLENGPALSLRDVLRIVRQVADALDYAHRQGIVHRDIKPSNILIDNQRRVKVADFGIAKVTGQSTELTVAGSVMGSPQYLSPEQIRGDDLDGRSDIFSLGVVLYELLSKKRPFDGDTITTLVYQILHKEPPPISELRAVPERLEKLLERMLAKSRDDRFATAAEVSAEVVGIERELSDETLSAPAADLPMQATHVLPRRTTEAQPVPAPGPEAPRIVTPPPVPWQAMSPTPQAPSPPPASQTTRQSTPGRGNKGSRIAVAVILAIVVVGSACGVAGWWIYQHWLKPSSPSTLAEVRPPDGSSPAVPASDHTDAPGPLSPAGTTAAATTTAPPLSPPVSPPAAPERRPPSSPAPAQTPPVQTERRPEPQVPAAPHPKETPVPLPQQRPASPEPQQPAAPVPAPVAEEEEAPTRRSQDSGVPPDTVLHTGLQLAFRPTPADAFVLVDGTQVGRASEWSGLKGARTFMLSGPGEHRIKLRSEGLREYRILVQASETAGVTPILARLKPLAAAQADASDLKVVRVKEGVAFRVEPATATLLVDGQEIGPAQRYGGRFAQPGTWLKLPPGRHRVGVKAPGYGRQDFLVEVTGGAEKDREKIEVTLQQGGAE